MKSRIKTAARCAGIILAIVAASHSWTPSPVAAAGPPVRRSTGMSAPMRSAPRTTSGFTNVPPPNRTYQHMGIINGTSSGGSRANVVIRTPITNRSIVTGGIVTTTRAINFPARPIVESAVTGRVAVGRPNLGQPATNTPVPAIIDTADLRTQVGTGPVNTGRLADSFRNAGPIRNILPPTTPVSNTPISNTPVPVAGPDLDIAEPSPDLVVRPTPAPPAGPGGLINPPRNPINIGDVLSGLKNLVDRLPVESGSSDGGSAGGGGAAVEPSAPSTGSQVVSSDVVATESAEPIAAPIAVDVELVDVRLIDAGNGRTTGPAFRIWVRNNGPIEIASPLEVVLVAGDDRPVSDTAPHAAAELKSPAAGELTSVDLRLPFAAYAVGTDAEGRPLPFTKIIAIVNLPETYADARDENNIASFDRDAVKLVDLKIMSVQVEAEGKTALLSGEGFGRYPGRIVLEAAGLKLLAEVVAWNHSQIRIKLPALDLVEAVTLATTVRREDGAVVASEIKIQPGK
jgi:hypothetical protein